MKVASFTDVNSCILTAHVPYITTSVLVVDLPPKHRNYGFFFSHSFAVLEEN